MFQKTKKKIKRNIPSGIVHIHSTFNNTIITVTDLKGNSVAWASAGTAGFKGTRKGTSFAAQLAAKKATLQAIDSGLKKVKVLVKGRGPGRETAIRALQTTGVKIVSIKDITPIPYNGCRPPNRRRV
jgi:small subunit ribosomal protein S11|uniref:Small ribosomal subunit protein uS11c n=1 Tax=Vaucheria litorea TaxID=109269 RepID=B7T1W4_VAULI|nr:ribosomal protein S11 [Vaucheria litorea]ACF70930.1 ribosomal protein S11 [Vaucheria litorea]